MNEFDDFVPDDEPEHSEDYKAAEELFQQFENGGFLFGQPEEMRLIPLRVLEDMEGYISTLEQRLAFAQQNIQDIISSVGRNTLLMPFTDKDRLKMCADLADCLNRMARGWDQQGNPMPLKYDIPMGQGPKRATK